MSISQSSSPDHKTTTKFGDIPPLIFVVVYVLVIIIFWIIFLFLPAGSFYHSTAQYERKFFDEDAKSILDSIKIEILDNLENHHPNLEVSENNWFINLSELQVYSLDVSQYPNSVSFQVFAPLEYVLEEKKYVEHTLHSTIQLKLNEEIFIDDRVYYLLSTKNTSLTKIEGIPDSPGVTILFPSKKSTITLPNISISLSLRNQILQFGEGYQGFPTNVSGNGIRMLYLSVGIATSTALGDITPITTMARTVILVEAMLSIVLISFFLNSLANTIVYARNPRQTLQKQSDQEVLENLLFQSIEQKFKDNPKE